MNNGKSRPREDVKTDVDSEYSQKDDIIEPSAKKSKTNAVGEDLRITIPQRELTDVEQMTLNHRRLGHLYMQKLIEAYKLGRVTGLKVPRSVLSRKALNRLQKCSTCYVYKQKRANFKPSVCDAPVFRPGEVLCGDIHVFINCPGHDGTKYMANFTDPSSNLILNYHLKSKEEFASKFNEVMVDYHRKYNLASWKYFYCDQESVLKTHEVDEFMKRNGITLITSVTDTPEMNGIAEQSNKWLGEVAGTMLHHSGRMKSFWTDAYDYAVQIRMMIPFQSPYGFMSPYQVLTGGIPNVSHFRVWGCKAWVLEPRVEHRKDWHAKSVIGWFAGLSPDNPRGYKIWIPELRDYVIAVNVTFDENIPDPGNEYHIALEEVLVPVNAEEASLKEMQKRYLHVKFIEEEDGLRYEVTKIKRNKDGYIVAEVTVEGGKKPSRAPLHIADIIRMLEQPVNAQNIVMILEEAVQGKRVGDTEVTSYHNCDPRVLRHNQHFGHDDCRSYKHDDVKGRLIEAVQDTVADRLIEAAHDAVADRIKENFVEAVDDTVADHMIEAVHDTVADQVNNI